MGTTLTGTTPQDTYDSLIKVTDNGPLSGTAKYLSDGLGNDSILALSTARVGIGTNVPSAMLTLNALDPFIRIERSGVPTWQIQNNTLAVDAGFSINNLTNAGTPFFINGTTNNVGIGTSSPSTTLHLDASGGATIRLQRTSASSNRFDVGTDGTNMEFNVRDTGSFTFGGSGSYLRLASGTGGIQFNGDTAAANALDDYEEGTWTITATPQSSGTITLGTNGGTYTKIGRQVTCTAFCILSAVSSPVGSYVQFGGLPFTSLNSSAARASVSLYFADASAGYASYVLPSYIPNNLNVFYGFLDVSTLAANDEFTIQITYFV